MNLENDQWNTGREIAEPGLKNHLFSFIQAADNKLAMKLFGSRTALQKEKRRQYAREGNTHQVNGLFTPAVTSGIFNYDCT